MSTTATGVRSGNFPGATTRSSRPPALRERDRSLMTHPFEGTIRRSANESVPAWPRPVEAPEGAPNIVVILLDDIGFADASTFGGPAQTPELTALAQAGLRFNNFNVTAMCSPTRASLLTGHNHHRVGFGILADFAGGFPGYNSVWN